MISACSTLVNICEESEEDSDSRVPLQLELEESGGSDAPRAPAVYSRLPGPDSRKTLGIGPALGSLRLTNFKKLQPEDGSSVEMRALSSAASINANLSLVSSSVLGVRSLLIPPRRADCVSTCTFQFCNRAAEDNVCRQEFTQPPHEYFCTRLFQRLTLV